MDARLFRSILPYVAGLAVAATLFIYVGHIGYTPRAGQLGPTTWPSLAIGLMALACLYEIVRRVATDNAVTGGIVEALDHEEKGEAAPKYPLLLAGGVVLVSVYAFAVPVLGFLLATFLFLAAFMYLGRYREHVWVWGASAAVTLFCGVLFLRIAYVSLPRGMPPFDRVTDAFFLIPGL